MANSPLSNRLSVQSGDVVSPRAKQKPGLGGLKPIEATTALKSVRVSSSTTPSRAADSETLSSDPHAAFGALDPELSGADRHFLGMLESDDISDAEADQAFNAYFF